MAKETILILEEESHIQWTLRTILENEKYNVIPVSTIRMAVQSFLESEVSGLITEYWIEESCTLEAIRELKKRCPEAYVMILTHHNVKENEYSKIMNAGIDDFFLKPLSSEKILIHLRKGLERRRISIQKKRFEEELADINAKMNTWKHTKEGNV
ncbi:MAG: response regulator [Thermodesulfobacteriota bacterium]